jgi:type I restriction enzyme S subunit
MKEPDSSTALPDGWAWKTLGELGRYYNGRAFKKTEWAASGRPIIRIQNLTDASKPFNYFQGDADEKHTVRAGDLLVSWAATLGVFRWDGEEAVVNQHIFKVESDIDPAFHMWALRSVLSSLGAKTRGSGMVHITRGDFLGHRVAVPPREEQRMIVSAIEDAFAQADEIETALHEVHRRREAFRMATLRDAFSGVLPCVLPVADPNGPAPRAGAGVRRPVEPPWGVPDHWQVTTMGDACKVVGGSTPAAKEPKYWGGDIQWIGVSDLTGYAEKWISGGARSLTQDGYESCSTTLMPQGSVLFSSRAPIGYVAIAAGPICTSQGFKSFVPPEDVDPEFLYWYLRALTPYARRRASGTTFPELSAKAAKALPLVVPPLAEQHCIVSAIEDAFAKVDEIDGVVVGAEADLASLRASVVHTAFAGELIRTAGSEKGSVAA